MLVGGPILGAIIYAFVVNGVGYGGYASPMGLVIVGLLTFLGTSIGFVLLLSGRTYEHDVEVGSDTD